jgi:hypothetical protein
MYGDARDRRPVFTKRDAYNWRNGHSCLLAATMCRECRVLCITSECRHYLQKSGELVLKCCFLFFMKQWYTFSLHILISTRTIWIVFTTVVGGKKRKITYSLLCVICAIMAVSTRKNIRREIYCCSVILFFCYTLHYVYLYHREN